MLIVNTIASSVRLLLAAGCDSRGECMVMELETPRSHEIRIGYFYSEDVRIRNCVGWFANGFYHSSPHP
jgi:hypothetical protein